MAFKTAATDIFLKTVNVIHRGVQKVSGGRLLSTLGSMPVVELHTTGRKSGQRRTTMLTAPIRDDERVVLVASKGGDDRDPAWYLNLTSNPEVEVTIDGETTQMTARTATQDEKAELWPAIVEAYAGYAGYQEKTDREIPVVICRPAA
jgi:deazaflavin-dependent oxidoreductase (nitroreductase family)